MKNLHLMWMDSIFNTRLVDVLNLRFKHDLNYFVYRTKRAFPNGIDNGVVDSGMFSAEAINRLSTQWDRIFLHSLYLKHKELLKLSPEAARKIVWVVWGHDLYKPLPKLRPDLYSIAYFCYRWLKTKSVFMYPYRRKEAKVISAFHAIAIGFPYGEVYIRKLYGPKVPVKYGPYFSKDVSMDYLESLRKLHIESSHSQTNIMIGHCGAECLQQEKYLKKLAKYKDEDIHI